MAISPQLNNFENASRFGMSKWVYLIKLDSASRNLRNLHYMYKKVVIITYPQFVAKFQTSEDISIL